MDRELDQGQFERRAHPRLCKVLAARLENPTKSRLAITRDISQTGALLLSEGRFQAGDSLRLSVLSPRTNIEIGMRGRVVRASIPTEGPWRCALALAFDEPLATESALLTGADGS